MMGKKYDLLLDKVYNQAELSAWVAENFTIHPAHQHFKQYYYQEWDDRDRYIHDHMYTTYYSQDQAKNANGGVWPTDFTKIRMRPGAINYIYNIMTGYHFKPPYGIDVPKGKYFNPYFDHMIIGMPRQLHDGMLDYEDGTPASTPQMASDITTLINYLQRRTGYKRSDRKIMEYMIVTAIILAIPIKHLKTNAYYRNLYSYRTEVYAVRDKLGYKHWKSGFHPVKAQQYRNNMWL